MKHTTNFKLHAVLWTLLGTVCFVSAPAMAEAKDMGCSPTVANPCTGGTPGGGGYSTPSHDYEAERAERNARYERILRDGRAAWERGDYREALRLLQQQQVLRDGPNVRNAIVQAKALIASQEAKEKAQKKAERDRIKREAEDAKVAAQMREEINKFALSLDTGPSGTGSVVSHGGTMGDAMGTHKATVHLEFGDPYALEARSEQARQGFDKARPLMGSQPIPRNDPGDAGNTPESRSALAAQVPDDAKNDSLITQSLVWYQQLDKLKAEAAHKLATAEEQLKQGAGDPAVLAAQVGTLTNQINQIDRDQTKATNDAKARVKHLGLEWNESAAPLTPTTETKTLPRNSKQP